MRTTGHGPSYGCLYVFRQKRYALERKRGQAKRDEMTSRLDRRSVIGGKLQAMQRSSGGKLSQLLTARENEPSSAFWQERVRDEADPRVKKELEFLWSYLDKGMRIRDDRFGYNLEG